MVGCSIFSDLATLDTKSTGIDMLIHDDLISGFA